MIITRDLINKNIVFEDLLLEKLSHPNTKSYTFDELSELIDVCKNALERHGAKPGETVLIGELAGKMQTALVFACAELGLTIDIIDHNRPDHWMNSNYIDPKTKLMMPIDYYLVDTTSDAVTALDNFKFFSKVCNKIITMVDEKVDTTPNNTIGATKDSVLMKCTSSGTTGIAKVITHNHEFMSSLIQRNSKFFDGSVFVIYNLNHGSSPATYFFPALASKNTEKILSASLHDIFSHERGSPEIRGVMKQTLEKVAKFNHLMIPYPNMVEPFLQSGSYPDTIIYTLTTIEKEWKSFLEDNKIKDIISIFGCNETSGPLFINKLSDKNFDPHTYTLVDDFYKIELAEREYLPKLKRNDLLTVTLPVYNEKVVTNDVFVLEKENRYIHQGREDLLRVNGAQISYMYQKTISNLVMADLVVDSINNALYLAVWEEHEKLEETVDVINEYLKHHSKGAHYISKYNMLEYSDFIKGVKLDQEILRDYFRDEQNNYQTVDQIDKKS